MFQVNEQTTESQEQPEKLLKAKDSQLLLLQEDVAELQFCLRESQSREEELATLARQLGQYLRTERPLRQVHPVIQSHSINLLYC